MSRSRDTQHVSVFLDEDPDVHISSDRIVIHSGDARSSVDVFISQKIVRQLSKELMISADALEHYLSNQ